MKSLSQINADIKEIEAEVANQQRTLLSLQLLELAGGDSSQLLLFKQQSAIKLTKTKILELRMRSEELLREKAKLLTEPLPTLPPPTSAPISTVSVSATTLVRFQHTDSNLSISSSSSSSSTCHTHGK